VNLSVIIVNWNSKDYLEKCIASIFRNTEGINYEIIVIDSASFDGCEHMLRNRYPQVHFIQSTTNLGFAKANNQAYQESLGDYLLFLNPDTELVSPAIKALYNAILDLPDAGIVGGKLLKGDGSVQTNCIQATPTILNQLLDSDYLRSRFPLSPLWGAACLYEDTSEPQVVDVLSGACLLVSRTVFERVGLFSEDYFMYGEDIDLCYKVRMAGHKNYYVPTASLFHFGGGSTDNSSSNFSAVMQRESICVFLRRTRGATYSLCYRVAMLFSALGRMLFLASTRPLHTATRYRRSRHASFQKWKTILAWSVIRKQGVNRCRTSG